MKNNNDHISKSAEVGLHPLSDYVNPWLIKCEVEQYKKGLPAIEEKEKVNPK